MEIAYQRFQPFLQDVSIDLRGRDICMPEKRLHDAQVSAVVQKVTGKGMAQDMGAES